MSRVSHRELMCCHSCSRRTYKKCPRCDVPLCGDCECAWVYENQGYFHIVVAPGTPYLRWYMSHWEEGLPPPRTKRYALGLSDVEGMLDQALDVLTDRLSAIWDRDDALLAIAERAIRVHRRDAQVVEAWNEYVQRENAKRRHRRLRGWKNRYYSRTIRPMRGQ